MATEAQVAEHLDISDRTVRELKGKGVFPAAKRGGMDLDVCRIAYVRHLRERAAGRASDAADDDDLDLVKERAGLAKEQRLKLERERARDERELASLPDMTMAVLTVIELSKSRLMRVGAIVAKGDTKLQGRIDLAVSDALDELSMTRVEEKVGGGANGEEAPDDGEGDAEA